MVHLFDILTPASTRKGNTVRNWKFALGCTTSILSGLSSLGGVAVAQETDEDQAYLQDVITVTATRRAEDLQDVPISISVVSGEDLAERGISDFSDVNQLAAGLYLEQDQGLSSSSIRIRGVGSQGFSSVDPSVGVIVDGVFQPRIGSAFTDLMDIERIEVLRGPQGTLFGKNTTAGVVRIITKAPDTEVFEGNAQLTAGNLGALEARGSINIPIVEDRLAARISGFTVERDGFIDNRLTGEDLRNQDRQGARIKLRWLPVDTLDLTYSGEFTETNYRADQALVRYGTLDSSRAGANSGAPLEDVAAFLGQTLPEIGPFRQEVFQDEQFAEDSVERHILTAELALPNHTLTSISAQETVEAFLPADNDGTQLTLAAITSAPVTETFTQEIQLASDFDGPLSYVVGVWYQDLETDSPTTSFDGADLAALEGRPQRPGTPINSEIKGETIAGFANVSYDVSDALRLTGGLRYTEDEKFQNQTISVFPVIDDRTETFDEWTWSLKAAHTLADGDLLYASYDRGFKSGGFNRQETLCFIVGAAFCLPDERLTFDPETTDSFEVGYKGNAINNRLNFNTAVFYQTYDDFQVTSRFPPSSIIVQNAASVETMGVEADFTAYLSDTFTVDGSIAYIDASYDSFTNAACDRTVDKSTTCEQDLSGRTLDNSPDWTINLGGEYRDVFSPITGTELFAGASVAYRSEVFLIDTLAPDAKQDGYALVDGRIGLESIDSPWTLTAWVLNAADEEYAVTGARPSGHSDGLRLTQGLPRTYGVTLGLRF